MLKACIIIPCFNESERLDFQAFNDFIVSTEGFDFLFVNDGSSDNTIELINGFRHRHLARITVLDLKVNGGKAEAVRQGVLHACSTNRYQYVGFWDADLATPLKEIPSIYEEAVARSKMIVISSRWKRLGATVERKPSRHVLGRIFSTFASVILKLPVYDTQCGAKLFKNELSGLFQEPFITKWLFDIEILARFRNQFGKERSLCEILERPVNEWKEVGGSKLKFIHMIKAPLELYSIHLKYNKIK